MSTARHHRRKSMARISMTPPQRRQPKAWMIGLAVLLFVSLVALQRPSSATRDGSKKASSFSADSPAGAAISSSSVAGMDAYQCNEGGPPSILLLHGSRFTKEDWKKSGILQQFCERDYTVWALDFPVASSFSVLERVLSELRPARPALVTPSAGGNAVVDWINNNQGTPLGDQILCWIPVASRHLWRSGCRWEEKYDLVGESGTDHTTPRATGSPSLLPGLAGCLCRGH